MPKLSSRFLFSAIIPLGISAVLLTGCGTEQPRSSVTSGLSSLGAMQGHVHGGRQPISGAHVYLYQFSTAGYGTAAKSLLTSFPGITQQDSENNYYVATDPYGNFSLTGDYQCTSGTYVYMFASGGNAGSGNNSAIGLLSALGECPSTQTLASQVPAVDINEVSTVVTAYALSGFAVDGTHIGNDGSSPNAGGTLTAFSIDNAFATVPNLLDVSKGQARATTPFGNGIVPVNTINEVADILASCVNSSDPSSTACSTLLGTALSGGATGTAPADTATAAINIAHHPANGVATLAGLVTATAPYLTTLANPNDFTLSVAYNESAAGYYGSNNSFPGAFQMDERGWVWMANFNGSSITQVGPQGSTENGAGYYSSSLSYPTAIALGTGAYSANYGNSTIGSFSQSFLSTSSSSTFTAPCLSSPLQLVQDIYGHLWTASYQSTEFCEVLPNNGQVAATSFNVPVTGLIYPSDMAADTAGHVWTTDQSSPSLFMATSTSTSPSFLGGTAAPVISLPGTTGSYGLAIDRNNNVWVALDNSVVRVSPTGTVGTPITGNGIYAPNGVAVDGDNNVWVVNTSSNAIVELDSSGNPLSGPNGFELSTTYYGAGVGIDLSGNVWFNDGASSTLWELIGAAAPTIDSVGQALALRMLGTRP